MKSVRQEGWFEDFTVGVVFRHARGKTVTEMDNVLLTNLVMNTAQGHFNEHEMQGTSFGQRITFGGITASLVIGLAAQDTAEHALAEQGIDKLRLTTPVFHGDTLYAYSEVLATLPEEQSGAGYVTFRHWGVNQRDEIVCEVERTVLIECRRAAS